MLSNWFLPELGCMIVRNQSSSKIRNVFALFHGPVGHGKREVMGVAMVTRTEVATGDIWWLFHEQRKELNHEPIRIKKSGGHIVEQIYS